MNQRSQGSDEQTNLTAGRDETRAHLLPLGPSLLPTHSPVAAWSLMHTQTELKSLIAMQSSFLSLMSEWDAARWRTPEQGGPSSQTAGQGGL